MFKHRLFKPANGDCNNFQREQSKDYKAPSDSIIMDSTILDLECPENLSLSEQREIRKKLNIPSIRVTPEPGH